MSPSPSWCANEQNLLHDLRVLAAPAVSRQPSTRAAEGLGLKKLFDRQQWARQLSSETPPGHEQQQRPARVTCTCDPSWPPWVFSPVHVTLRHLPGSLQHITRSQSAHPAATHVAATGDSVRTCSTHGEGAKGAPNHSVACRCLSPGLASNQIAASQHTPCNKQRH